MAKTIKNNTTELEITSKITKDTKKIIEKAANTTEISRVEMKFICGLFRQAQRARIAVENQIRALRQEADEKPDGVTFSILTWEYNNQVVREKELLKILKLAAESCEVGRWLTSIKGIGPTIAAELIAYLDVTKVSYGSQFISYCGLNSQSAELGGRPWNGKEASRKIVEEVLGDDEKLTSSHIIKIAAKSKWSVAHIEKDAATYDKNGNITGYSKEAVIKSISKIPYNKDLKTLCYKIGESFVKVSGNKDSLYGKLYKQYRANYTTLNEAGAFAERAAKILKEKNFSKSTNAYKAYSQGKLPDAHIIAMAKRKAVTIFISHLYEEMAIVAGMTPAFPYVFGEALGDKGHRDYIAPEKEYSYGYVSPLETKDKFVIDLSKDVDVEADFLEEDRAYKESLLEAASSLEN